MISAKSTVSNASASIATSNMNVPSAIPAAVATTTVTTSHRDYATAPLVNRSHSPRGHSPTRERDSYRCDISFRFSLGTLLYHQHLLIGSRVRVFDYSSNVSSLSRGSVHTPISNSSPFSIPSVPVPAPSAHANMPTAVPIPPSVPVSSSLNLSNKPSIWGPVG